MTVRCEAVYTMSVYHSLLRPVVAEAIQTLLDFASGPLFAEKFALAFETPAPSLAAFRSAIASLEQVGISSKLRRV